MNNSFSCAVSLCFLGWEDQVQLFDNVYSSLPVEDKGHNSTFVYLTWTSAASFSVLGCFMVTSKIVCNGFQTHTISSCASRNLCSAHIMKQTGLHSERRITSALISEHYIESCLTFIQSSVVTWGHSANENQPTVCMQNSMKVYQQNIFFLLQWTYIQYELSHAWL